MILILAVLGLGAEVIVQQRTIAELRANVAAVRQQSAAADDRGKREEQEVARLREKTEIFKTESETLRTKLAAISPAEAAAARAATAAAGAKPDGSPAGAEASKPGEASAGGFGKAMAKMFTDPEMKKVMRQQQAVGIRMMYGDLAKELGLNTDELDQTLNLLTERQMEMTDKSMGLMDGSGDAAKQEAAGKEINAAREKQDRKLKELLGPQRFAQFESYEKTMGDRMMMQQYQQQFSISEQPLEETQRTELLKILNDERAKTPVTALDPTSKDVASQMRAMQSDESMHSYLASQEDFNRRVLSRAAAVLGPEQMGTFERIQKQMSEMQQAGIKMSRAMLKR